ncbi:MAG TPA: hypothetical protein VJ646_10445 [Candidatus Binatia bacterium]|nr:hypothetical protein [Candidatus Binatia bacterium]
MDPFDVADRWRLRYLSKRLGALELELAKLASKTPSSKQTNFVRIKLNLGVRALASANAAIALLTRCFWQESDGPFRLFLEAWVVLMNIWWFQRDPLTEKWLRGERIKGKDIETFRSRVESELARLPDANHGYPLKDLYKILSGESVHITPTGVVRAQQEALYRKNVHLKTWQRNRLSAIGWLKTELILSGLQLWIKLYRADIQTSFPQALNDGEWLAIEKSVGRRVTGTSQRTAMSLAKKLSF